MNFVPMYDFVLVQVEEAEKKTSGGLFIPQTAQEATNRAQVIATGPGRTTDEGVTIPVDLKQGETVMYTAGTGHPIKVEGEQYLVLKEEDIFAVVE